MARPKQAPRLNLVGAHPKIREALQKIICEFEQRIRKYYPKKSKFFYNGLHHQPSDASNFGKGNRRILQRYKRSFIRSFDADSPPSKIPDNLQRLKIFEGSQIVLRKMIKQNKRLQHIVFESEDYETNIEIVRYLRYSKSLRSIVFQHKLPILSKRECKRMLKTWGKTIERVKIGFGHNVANVMEIFLEFPKLKEFELGSLIQSFPYDKLQERNVNYSIHLDPRKDVPFEFMIKNQTQFKFSDHVCVKETDYSDSSEKMSLERYKIQKNSKQKHFLEPTGIVPLVLDFQNIISLDVILIRGTLDCFNMGQLNNLKHLSIDMCNGGEESENRFEILFRYLNKNVAPHKNLETFLLKSGVWGHNIHNEKLALSFFEACSETLRKVHFEFEYDTLDSEEFKWLLQGLSKLKNLQSLSLFLDFFWCKSNETTEKLWKIIPEIKSLKELDFRLRINEHQKKALNLKFPPQLKKLSLGLNASNAPGNALKTLGSLSNLLHLELEFFDFTPAKWSKILQNRTDKLKLLEVLILKEREKLFNRNEMSQIKEKLYRLMKESSNLKLIIFASMKSEEIVILRRNNCLWSEINPVVDDLSFQKNVKVNYIKTY